MSIYFLYAAFLIIAALIVTIVVLNSKNNKLQLKTDEAEYLAVTANGKLTKLSLEYADLDTECEQAKADLDYCKRKRNKKGQFVPRKRK